MFWEMPLLSEAFFFFLRFFDFFSPESMFVPKSDVGAEKPGTSTLFLFSIDFKSHWDDNNKIILKNQVYNQIRICKKHNLTKIQNVLKFNCANL